MSVETGWLLINIMKETLLVQKETKRNVNGSLPSVVDFVDGILDVTMVKLCHHPAHSQGLSSDTCEDDAFEDLKDLQYAANIFGDLGRMEIIMKNAVQAVSIVRRRLDVALAKSSLAKAMGKCLASLPDELLKIILELVISNYKDLLLLSGTNRPFRRILCSELSREIWAKFMLDVLDASRVIYDEKQIATFQHFVEQSRGANFAAYIRPGSVDFDSLLLQICKQAGRLCRLSVIHCLEVGEEDVEDIVARFRRLGFRGLEMNMLTDIEFEHSRASCLYKQLNWSTPNLQRITFRYTPFQPFVINDLHNPRELQLSFEGDESMWLTSATPDLFPSTLVQSFSGPNFSNLSKLVLDFWFHHVPSSPPSPAPVFLMDFAMQSGAGVVVLPLVTRLGLYVVHNDISSFDLVASIVQKIRLPSIDTVDLRVGPKTPYEAWGRDMNSDIVLGAMSRVQELVPEKHLICDFNLEIYQAPWSETRHDNNRVLYLDEFVANMCRLTNFTFSCDMLLSIHAPLTTLPHLQKIAFMGCARLHPRILRESITALKNSVWTRNKSVLVLRESNIIQVNDQNQNFEDPFRLAVKLLGGESNVKLEFNGEELFADDNRH